MLKIQLDNLFKISTQHSLSKSEVKNFSKKFPKIKDMVLSRGQGFYNLGKDTALAKKIQNFAAKEASKFKDIVVIGIGGSMLGPQVIYEALGLRSNKNFYALDNIDPYVIETVISKLRLKDTLFLVQTKSGGTPETLSVYFYVKDLLEKNGFEAKKHFVFVTDPDKGYLRSVEDQALATFPIPENVGGRFSVLSSIGLVIAALLEIDILEMLRGGDEIAQSYFLDENPNSGIFNLAAVQYSLLEKGKNLAVLMPYSSRLKNFSAWYVQLISESIGKELDLNNKLVNVGITPVPALGATDQHSQMQLFKEGPNDKLIFFLEVDDFEVDLAINLDPKAAGKFSYLKGKTFNQLISAELEGTRQSLTESERPNITLKIKKLNAYTLGALFMLFELKVAFLGEFLNINTFNQPGVERSKVLTGEILSNEAVK